MALIQESGRRLDSKSSFAAAAENGEKAQTAYQLSWYERIPAAYWILSVLLLIMPALVSDFALYQIFGWTYCLGMVALSLMLLAGYGGMVSLVQVTIAALSGYMLAIFGTSAIDAISLGWPWWISIPIALVVAVIFGTAVGALAVRTEGIYTIMITLAIASAFFYFTRQNYVLFNGFSGFNGVLPPPLFGVDWRAPIPFYYMTLFFGVLSFLFVLYISRAPFGLALQGVRDNPRRMAALGFNVNAHRIAAFALAAFIAGLAGILLVWQTGQISPGSAGIALVVDVLVIAVIGGMKHPIGPFIGAFIYVLLKIFAPNVLIAIGLSGDRFQLLVGLTFLIIVFFSPDGILGLWEKFKESRNRDPLLGKVSGKNSDEGTR